MATQTTFKAVAKRLKTNAYRLAAAASASRNARVAALLCCSVCLQPASSQETGGVTVDVDACIALETEAARLECFASRVEAAVKAREAAVADEADAAIEARAAEQDQRSEGADPARRERRAQQRADTAADRPDEASRPEAGDVQAGEFSGTIVALSERVPEAYVITLDNGQIWEQTDPKRYPLRPGLEVTIRPTRWGPSYRLTGDGAGGYIQVRRVQ